MVRFALIVLIRLYQLVFRRFHSRRCLFRPTCSEFALETLRSDQGLLEAVMTIRGRLHRCKPPFQVHALGAHGVTLITNDGQRFEARQINPALIAEFVGVE